MQLTAAIMAETVYKNIDFPELRFAAADGCIQPSVELTVKPVTIRQLFSVCRKMKVFRQDQEN